MSAGDSERQFETIPGAQAGPALPETLPAVPADTVLSDLGIVGQLNALLMAGEQAAGLQGGAHYRRVVLGAIASIYEDLPASARDRIASHARRIGESLTTEEIERPELPDPTIMTTRELRYAAATEAQSRGGASLPDNMLLLEGQDLTRLHFVLPQAPSFRLRDTHGELSPAFRLDTDVVPALAARFLASAMSGGKTLDPAIAERVKGLSDAKVSELFLFGAALYRIMRHDPAYALTKVDATMRQVVGYVAGEPDHAISGLPGDASRSDLSHVRRNRRLAIERLDRVLPVLHVALELEEQHEDMQLIGSRSGRFGAGLQFMPQALKLLEAAARVPFVRGMDVSPYRSRGQLDDTLKTIGEEMIGAFEVALEQHQEGVRRQAVKAVKLHMQDVSMEEIARELGVGGPVVQAILAGFSTFVARKYTPDVVDDASALLLIPPAELDDKDFEDNEEVTGIDKVAELVDLADDDRAELAEILGHIKRDRFVPPVLGTPIYEALSAQGLERLSEAKRAFLANLFARQNSMREVCGVLLKSQLILPPGGENAQTMDRVLAYLSEQMIALLGEIVDELTADELERQ